MKLTHPDTGQTIDVRPSSAPVYETQGWARTPDPVKTPAPVDVKPPAIAGTEKKEKTNG